MYAYEVINMRVIFVVNGKAIVDTEMDSTPRVNDSVSIDREEYKVDLIEWDIHKVGSIDIKQSLVVRQVRCLIRLKLIPANANVHFISPNTPPTERPLLPM